MSKNEIKNEVSRINIDDKTSIELIQNVELSLRDNNKAKIILFPKKFKFGKNGYRIGSFKVIMPKFKYKKDQLDSVNTLKRIMKCCNLCKNPYNAIELLTMSYKFNKNLFKIKYTQIPTARESEVLDFVIKDMIYYSN